MNSVFPFGPDPTRPQGIWGPHVGEIYAAMLAGTPAPPAVMTPEQVAEQGAWEAEQRRLRVEEHRLWLERAATEIALISDPAERIVRVVSAAVGIPGNTSEGWPPPSFQVGAEALQSLLPDLFPPGQEISINPPPWDHELILSWFRGATKEPPTPAIAVSVRGFFGPRIRRVQAWVFRYGSTRVEQPKEGHPHFAWIAIDLDGRVLYNHNSLFTLEPGSIGESFNARALAQMASLTQLPALGEDALRPPRPATR